MRKVVIALSLLMLLGLRCCSQSPLPAFGPNSLGSSLGIYDSLALLVGEVWARAIWVVAWLGFGVALMRSLRRGGELEDLEHEAKLVAYEERRGFELPNESLLHPRPNNTLERTRGE